MKIDLTEFGAVTGAILILGGTLKHSGVPGKFIPAITWLLGIMAYLALTSGWTDGAQWVAGFMAAASGTGLHSASKNTLGKPNKATKSAATLALCFALGLLGPLALTGCKTSSDGQGRSAQAISYQTLKSTQLAVDAAMQVYGTAVVTGKVDVDLQEKIDQAHYNYRQSFRLAVAAARMDRETLTPEDVADLAYEVLLLTSTLNP